MDYHSDRFQDFSLMVYKDEKLVALLPANRVKDKVYSHQGLTYGGLIFANDEKTRNLSGYFKAILEFLEGQGIETLNLKMLPEIYCKRNNQAVDYLLSIVEAHNYRTDVLSVADPKAKNYSRDRIAGYKRGLKHKLQIRETQDMSEFWNEILIPNLKRKHKIKPVHSLEEIELLKSRFTSNIRQFNVYYNDNIVAGTTVFDTPFVAHSQYISGNSEKNKLGSLDILHIYLLQEVFNGKKFFDFGISNENDGKTINEGLLYWKEGFGAAPYTQKFYRVQTLKYKLLDSVLI